MYLAYKKISSGAGHAVGRELLRQLYTEHVGADMPSILITDRGKPYFATGPWHFSISHTKHYVFCVLSEKPVGLDAEEMDRQINLQLAEKILSPTEKAIYDSQTDQRVALLKFWVLKEAAAKLSGEGLKGYPNQTDFDPNDPRVQTIDNCYVAIIVEN